MKIIYNRSSNKTSFYKSMGSWKGVTSTLGFVDYRAAAPSRNNLLQCFQNRNLSVLVEKLESHVDEFIQLLKTSTKEDSTVDGVVVFRLLALDHHRVRLRAGGQSRRPGALVSAQRSAIGKQEARPATAWLFICPGDGSERERGGGFGCFGGRFSQQQ